MLNPACACVFFGLQRIFKFCPICYKHFKIVRFCIEIQLSIFSGKKKIRLSGNHRSQFLTWQPWAGAECLSHWRLRHCWVWHPPPPPPCVSPTLPRRWLSLTALSHKNCALRRSQARASLPPTPGEMSCLFFIFLAQPHPSNSAESPLSDGRLIWHPNTKLLCLPVNSHHNDHWSYLFGDQLYLDSRHLSYCYLGGNLNSISFYSL